MVTNGETGTDRPTTPSIDASEIDKFTAMAAEWWDPKGKFRPLHKFNPVRLSFLRDTITEHFSRDPSARRPLEGLRLVDIGCGGGLVSEPMARLGATVTGIDAGDANIKTAMVHAEQSGVSVDFRVGTAEGLLTSGEPPFDVVLTLEVVEHVADPHSFLVDCGRLLAPGGIMVVATLNRTAKAWALAVVGAEYVLGWLPRGTHDVRKFITPDEIEAAALEAGLSARPAQGVSYSPLMDRWSLSADTAVNYMMVATRSN
ncbi:MAG: bifunctional 2-polyprenyl-6-hydroxyphenol methylase/3-demethylubiquinol 3-O-methyltransferase UbiG [Pseudomonadota bacterium]